MWCLAIVNQKLHEKRQEFCETDFGFVDTRRVIYEVEFGVAYPFCILVMS